MCIYITLSLLNFLLLLTICDYIISVLDMIFGMIYFMSPHFMFEKKTDYPVQVSLVGDTLTSCILSSGPVYFPQYKKVTLFSTQENQNTQIPFLPLIHETAYFLLFRIIVSDNAGYCNACRICIQLFSTSFFHDAVSLKCFLNYLFIDILGY